MTTEPKADSPLALMLAIMRDETNPPELRLQAAIGAAPYCHQRLLMIDHGGKAGRVPGELVGQLDEDDLGLH